MRFPLLPNQVHTGHDLVHMFCAVYLGPRDMKFSAPCITGKSEARAFQGYTIYLVFCNGIVSYGSAKFSVADAIRLLTPRGSDNEEELSEDEIICDFVTEGDESIVLSSEMLSRVPAITLASLASEIDSLLLG